MDRNWKKVKLGDITKPKQWPTLTKKDLLTSGFPVFGANGIIGYSNQITHSEDTILIACRGTCGKVNIGRGKFYANGNAMALDQLDSQQVNLDFLAGYLDFRGLSDVTTGTSQPQITRENLIGVEISIPPLDEQIRIASILAQAELNIDKQLKALDLYKELQLSIFQQIFDIPKSQKKAEVCISEIAEISTGYAFKSEEYSTDISDFRLLRGANVLPDRLEWKNVARLSRSQYSDFPEMQMRSDDIVLAMDRPWISEGFKIARVTDGDLPSLLVQRVCRFRAKKSISPLFLYFVLMSKSFQEHCVTTETLVPHISTVEIKSFKFEMPGSQALSKFDSQMQQIELLINATNVSLCKSKELYESLRDSAYKGEL